MASFALVLWGVAQTFLTLGRGRRIKRTAALYKSYRVGLDKRKATLAALKKKLSECQKTRGAKSVKLARIGEELESLRRTGDREFAHFNALAKRINR